MWCGPEAILVRFANRKKGLTVLDCLASGHKDLVDNPGMTRDNIIGNAKHGEDGGDGLFRHLGARTDRRARLTVVADHRGADHMKRGRKIGGLRTWLGPAWGFR